MVGSGVIGLTTAVRLAEAGVRVQIVTAAMPQETTSRAAGAIWGSSFAAPAGRVRRWAEDTLEELRREAGDPATGVRIAGGVLGSRSTADGPPEFLFPGVSISPGHPPPPGFVAAFSVNVPVADMPRHLDYLLARLGRAGGEIEVRRLDALEDVAGEAPVVVNCAGIGARDLVPDPELRPLRGQHVVVENPGLDEFFMEEPVARWASWIPHGDEVVLGGLAQEDEWSLEPDPAVAQEILARCAEVEPQLADVRVIEHRVGLRPARPVVRLEAEALGEALCVHNYGHGGTGVGLAWGCARDVLEIVRQRAGHE